MIFLKILILNDKRAPDRKSLVIASQPFIENDFYKRCSVFAASNRFMMESASVPEISGPNYLYVRGDNSDSDCRVMSIPREYYHNGFLARLRIAVKEYNAFLTDRYETAIAIQNNTLGPDYSYEIFEKKNKKTIQVLV